MSGFDGRPVFDTTPLTPNEAGKKLSHLMERQLGYVEGHIDNVALRLFIRAYWSRVSAYAHAIHNESADV